MCEVLRDRRGKSTPAAIAASSDESSSGEDSGAPDVDVEEESTGSNTTEHESAERHKVETKRPATNSARSQDVKKTKKIPQISGQKSLTSFFGASTKASTASSPASESNSPFMDLSAKATASSSPKSSGRKREAIDGGGEPMILLPPSALPSREAKKNRTNIDVSKKKPATEKPKNAKVWNKTVAMMIKEKKLRHEKDNITNFFKGTNDAIWKDARKAIKAKTAEEIFVGQNGQIIGLPSNLDKRVRRFCKQVITGDPEVYLSKEQNRYLKDNGKRSISIGGETAKIDPDGNTTNTSQLSGSFALLMALHESDDGDGIYTTSELQKKQEAICGREVAQKIEGVKGYLCGVWTRSISTLEGHGLVKRTERGENTKLGRKGSQDTFELTKDGEIFIKALVRYRGDEVKKFYRKDIQEEYFSGVESMKYKDLRSVAKKRRRLH